MYIIRLLNMKYCCNIKMFLGLKVVKTIISGNWSSPPPTCEQTFCPTPRSLGPHLSVVEYNSSFGGRAMFACAWGYRLVGAPGLECEYDGRWSGETPHCLRECYATLIVEGNWRNGRHKGDPV